MPCCYIIKCKCNQIYVGSTTRKIETREKEHQSECYNPKRASYKSPAYKHFRECNLERNNIKCIELFQCGAEERFDREAQLIKAIGSLNSVSSTIDLDKCEARRQKYALQGKVQHICSCGGTWTHHHKIRHSKTNIHQKYLEEENDKKLKYLKFINDQKETIKTIPIHYSISQKCYIKDQ